MKQKKIINLQSKLRNKLLKKGVKMIYQNNDTCNLEKFGVVESEKKTNLKKVVYISPVIIFGIILIYQLIKVYCKMKRLHK